MERIPRPSNNVNETEETELEPLEPDTLLVENEALRKGFTVIPNYVLRNPLTSLGARMTFTLLLSYAWQEGSCFPGQKRLARDLGIKERMVRYYLTELQKSGFIEAKRRGMGKTNVYVIKDVQPDRQNIAGQDRQSIADQERQNIAYKENTDIQKHNNTVGDAAAAAALEKVGVDEKASRRLIEHYSLQRIFEKIDYYYCEEETNPGKIKNSGAYVRRAIEEDWGPPAGYKPKEQRDAERAASELRKRRIEQAGAAPARPWRDWLIATQKVPNELVSLTDKLRELLKEEQPPEVYSTVESSMMVVDAQGAHVKIVLASRSAKSALEARTGEVGKALTRFLGRPVEVKFELIEKPFDLL